MFSSSHIDFEWDDAKASSNARKHGVTFREASAAFADPYGRIIDDPDHSDDEERFILIGMSLSARVLTVCHCLRKEDSVIRIISARKATRPEEDQYWRYRK